MRTSLAKENPDALKYQERYQRVLGMMREAEGLEKTSSKKYEDKRESTENQEKGGEHCGRADKAPREDLENTVRVATA